VAAELAGDRPGGVVLAGRDGQVEVGDRPVEQALADGAADDPRIRAAERVRGRAHRTGLAQARVERHP
jgi:hypothetical protein